MSSSIDTLDAIAPEYASEPTATKETFLEMAAQRMTPEVWGRLYEQAAAYLAAHLLKVRQRGEDFAASGGAGAGGVSSVSTGDLSVSFEGAGDGAQTLNEEALSSTEYGQQYLHLRGQLSAGAGFLADGS